MQWHHQKNGKRKYLLSSRPGGDRSLLNDFLEALKTIKSKKIYWLDSRNQNLSSLPHKRPSRSDHRCNTGLAKAPISEQRPTSILLMRQYKNMVQFEDTLCHSKTPQVYIILELPITEKNQELHTCYHSSLCCTGHRYHIPISTSRTTPSSPIVRRF